MSKKKSNNESYIEDEPQDETEADSALDADVGTQPEVTSTEATEEGVYKTGQACTIKGVAYEEGAEVALTPEELATVQEVGVKIYPA